MFETRFVKLARLATPSKAFSSVALSIVLVLVLGTSQAIGATSKTLYVDRFDLACSNSGVGSRLHPFCTISAAASRVAAGQTVLVASGTYHETVRVPDSGKSGAPIRFTAALGGSVTLRGGTNGFLISGRRWITINGFSVIHTSSYGINVTDSSHVRISANHVQFSGSPVSGRTSTGIRIKNTTDSLIVRNTSDHNTYAGIMVMGVSSTRNEVRGNTTFSNAEGYQRAAPGIRIYKGSGNVIDNNVTYDNEDSGIECYAGANGTLIYNNISYHNGDHGIDALASAGSRIIANSVYDNVTAGINLEGGSTGGTVENNLSVDNGVESPRTPGDIRVDSDSTAGTAVDYNTVFSTAPDTLLIWSSVGYTTLAAFQAASGQMAHGTVADPEWADPSAGDFQLTGGSPAIDSANSGVSGQPSTDIDGHPRVDDPATTDTGSGPRTYDDRGAGEFQPMVGTNRPGTRRRIPDRPTHLASLGLGLSNGCL
jgi:parallel beta-helix repeat protein